VQPITACTHCDRCWRARCQRIRGIIVHRLGHLSSDERDKTKLLCSKILGKSPSHTHNAPRSRLCSLSRRIAPPLHAHPVRRTDLRKHNARCANNDKHHNSKPKLPRNTVVVFVSFRASARCVDAVTQCHHSRNSRYRQRIVLATVHCERNCVYRSVARQSRNSRTALPVTSSTITDRKNNHSKHTRSYTINYVPVASKCSTAIEATARRVTRRRGKACAAAKRHAHARHVAAAMLNKAAAAAAAAAAAPVADIGEERVECAVRHVRRRTTTEPCFAPRPRQRRRCRRCHTRRHPRVVDRRIHESPIAIRGRLRIKSRRWRTDAPQAR
jgi:hypothetical protein